MKEPPEKEAVEIPVLVGDEKEREFSWKMYALMEATGWRFLPSQIMDEDDVLMQNIFSIASYVNKTRITTNG